MIGQRLKLARAAAGLSLRGLQAKIDSRVTAQALSKYERNESMPGSAALLAIAAALSVSVPYLVGDQDMVLETVEFRTKKLVGKRERVQIEARVLYLLERYLVVEELLNLPSVNRDLPSEAPWTVSRDIAEAEDAARRLRAHWRLGHAPLPNLVELLEERGIKVLSVALAKVDGLLARVRRRNGSIVPLIAVKEDLCGQRQRFTLAHELGHLVLHVSPGVNRELTAHRFASAFLMPAEMIWSEVGRHRHSMCWEELFALKQIFGVSLQAFAYRCRDLGILSPALFRSLFREFAARGWGRPPYEEPQPMPGETPKRFERLCCWALAEGAISDSKAAELLEISVHDLRRRMDQLPPADSSGSEFRP